MEFISAEMLFSLAGCVAIVAIITQAIKTYFEKLNPLMINFIASVIIGTIRICLVGEFAPEAIVIGILNIFVIMLAAGGSYDTVKEIYTTVKGDE